jgi:hypothetical protein
MFTKCFKYELVTLVHCLQIKLRCDKSILKIKCCKNDKRIHIVCINETLMSAINWINRN